jgi:hypothetical protein
MYHDYKLSNFKMISEQWIVEEAEGKVIIKFYILHRNFPEGTEK